MVSKDPMTILHFTKSNNDLRIPTNGLAKENNMRLIEEIKLNPEDIKGRITNIQKTSIKDFEILALLGKGAYAKVVLAYNIYNGKEYAVKVIDKNFIDQQHKQYEVHIERHVLRTLSHPNIIKLNLSFQDSRKLYFVLEYCKRKDLATLSRIIGKFPLNIGRYYAAEILSAIEHMHSKGVYHRDLKAENIALTEEFHLKVIDFGTANVLGQFFDLKTMKFVHIANEESKQKISEDLLIDEIEVDSYRIHNLLKDFVGSTQYVSPEVLSKDYSHIGPSVDLWAFGVLLFLMFQGRLPFQALTKEETFDKILKCDYAFDKDINEDVKDLIIKLLLLQPHKRIGHGDYSYTEIKSHPFFKGIDFANFAASTAPSELSKLFEAYYKFEAPQHRKDYFFTKDSLVQIKVQSKPFASESIPEMISSLSANETNPLINQLTAKPKHILIENILQKKSPWFHYNTRLVKLYSDGSAEYLEPSSKKVKGTFEINEHCAVVLIDDFRFNLRTSMREYVFKNVKERLAGKWVDSISLLIKARKAQRRKGNIKHI